MSISIKGDKTGLYSVRVEPGEDLVNSLKLIIANGIIVTCIGSLQYATMILLQKDFKYSRPKRIDGPVELLSAQGTVGLDDGKIGVHLHGIISDPDWRVYGGHFVDDEDGNLVFATVEICILVPENISFVKQYDNKTGFKVFNPYKR